MIVLILLGAVVAVVVAVLALAVAGQCLAQMRSIDYRVHVVEQEIANWSADDDDQPDSDEITSSLEQALQIDVRELNAKHHSWTKQ